MFFIASSCLSFILLLPNFKVGALRNPRVQPWACLGIGLRRAADKEGISAWPSLLEAQELYGQLNFAFSYLKLCVRGLCTTPMLDVHGGRGIGSLELGLLVAISQHGCRTLYQSS